ncbi:glycosyl transferase family protein [Pseudomonas aeruginosa MH38]|nr:glycosyl transferase family protein [Pseudomonas aeruginosa MH38]
MHAPGAFRLGRRRCHRRSLPGADPPGRGLRRRRRRGRRDGSRLRGSGCLPGASPEDFPPPWPGVPFAAALLRRQPALRTRQRRPGVAARRPRRTRLPPGPARRDRRTAVGDLSPSSTLDLLMMIEPSLASKLEAPCLLSVVVPVFNEEAVLPAFHQRLGAVLGDLGDDCEVLYVDDGSTDRSATILAQLQAADRRVGVARFTRNFGKEQAMSAGLKLSRGAAVIVIDADLQDPPELIPQMLDAWIGGAEMVNMRRRSRAGESWLKRASASAFYRLINRLSEVPIPRDVGDFRLLDRRVVDALCELPEGNRFMKGLFAWVGFRQVDIAYSRAARVAGHSKWRYWRLWNFALEGITGFSTAPLKVAGYLGLLSLLAALATLLAGIFGQQEIHEHWPVIAALFLIGGLQLLAIGVCSEYLGRMTMEARRRPLYLIDRYLPAQVGGANP